MNTVVAGQVARDLVLRVDHAPGPHEAVAATEKIEVLGGKGANIAVVHRRGVATGVIVDIVDNDGHWHYVEYLPPEVLLTEEDVHAARDILAKAQRVVVQLRQPAAAAMAAVRLATGFVVLDGAPESPWSTRPAPATR
jgi:ribokinase